MFTTDIIDRVLVNPAENCDKLEIVSGYASPSMVEKHLGLLNEFSHQIEIELIIGMTIRDEIHDIQHDRFKHLTESTKSLRKFKCNYITRGIPVHAKTYCWLKRGKPQVAFIGSPNYTITGFSSKQGEVIEKSDPSQTSSFFHETLKNSTSISQIDKSCNTFIHDTWKLFLTNQKVIQSIELSLLTNSGKIHNKSGLNWGITETSSRNCSYILIPKAIRETNFFPERDWIFHAKTDDNKIFSFVRKQAAGKGLQTKDANSFGEYIRHRIGVSSKSYITKENLQKYGRTSITFHKISEDVFLIDFKPHS